MEEEDKKDEDLEEEVDERTKRKAKTLDSFEIAHEQDLSKDTGYAFSLACAEATVFARNLANTRGSEADPDWMESKVHELLASK